jgi:hypothetical protein
MSTVPVEMGGDLEVRETDKNAASELRTAVLLGLAAVAITAFWVFVFFVIVPALFA